MARPPAARRQQRRHHHRRPDSSTIDRCELPREFVRRLAHLARDVLALISAADRFLGVPGMTSIGTLPTPSRYMKCGDD